jgi:hypothetical protein
MRRGERIDHYETIRRTKDGRNIVISLSDSPNKDSLENVIGSKNRTRHYRPEAGRRSDAHRAGAFGGRREHHGECRYALQSRFALPLGKPGICPEWSRKEPEEIAGRKIADVIGNEGYEAIRPHIEQGLSGKKEEYEELVKRFRLALDSRCLCGNKS